MSEPIPIYSTKSNCTFYELTPVETRLIDWIRRESSNGRDWIGTIRFVSGPNVYQMFNGQKAGQMQSN